MRSLLVRSDARARPCVIPLIQPLIVLNTLGNHHLVHLVTHNTSNACLEIHFTSNYCVRLFLTFYAVTFIQIFVGNLHYHVKYFRSIHSGCLVPLKIYLISNNFIIYHQIHFCNKRSAESFIFNLRY